MFKTIDEIKSLNKRNGGHFFERSTMKFFASKICETVYGGRYFLTTEKTGFRDKTRCYTVRRASDSGDVTTVETLSKYADKAEAVRVVKAWANGSRRFRVAAFVKVDLYGRGRLSSERRELEAATYIARYNPLASFDTKDSAESEARSCDHEAERIGADYEFLAEPHTPEQTEGKTDANN